MRPPEDKNLARTEPETHYTTENVKKKFGKKKGLFCEPGRGVKQGEGKGSMYMV